MKNHRLVVRTIAGLALSAALALSVGAAFAGDREHGGGDDHPSSGFSSHPTLPVPAALVFGGLAIAGVAGALQRRRNARRSTVDKSK